MKKLCLIFVALFFGTTQINASEIKAEPALKITTLDGKNFNLKENRGKVVIINFWAKWCSDCRREMPILEELYKKYKSSGLEIIGVSTDRRSQRSKVIKASAEVTYKIAMIHEATENSLEEPTIIPTNYIIDRNGKFVAKLIGNEDDDETKKKFEETLKPLLERKN